MPVLSWGHSQYWAGSGTAPAPPAASDAIVGYVPWQTSVVVGSMFGGLQPVWEWVVTVTRRTRTNGDA